MRLQVLLCVLGSASRPSVLNHSSHVEASMTSKKRKYQNYKQCKYHAFRVNTLCKQCKYHAFRVNTLYVIHLDCRGEMPRFSSAIVTRTGQLPLRPDGIMRQPLWPCNRRRFNRPQHFLQKPQPSQCITSSNTNYYVSIS